MGFWERCKNTIMHPLTIVATGMAAGIGGKVAVLAGGKAGVAVATVAGTAAGAAAVVVATAVVVSVTSTVVHHAARGAHIIVKGVTDARVRPNYYEPFARGDARPNTRRTDPKKYVAKVTKSSKNAKKIKELDASWTVKEVSNQKENKKDPEKEKEEEKGEDCSECIPQTDEKIDELCKLIKSLSNLLDYIREVCLLGLTDEINVIFDEMIKLLTELIHTHGSVFQRSEAPEARGIRLIPFRNDQVREALGQNPPDLFFDNNIQQFFSTMLANFIGDDKTESLRNFQGLIYCIQCVKCRTLENRPEFNYVGQAVTNMATRGSKHITVIKTEKGHPLHIHLVEIHRYQTDAINAIILSNAYKIYLVHDLSDNATSPREVKSCKRETDKRIRRSWEMFYQWIYRAMESDGGGSRR